jgi:hypothetical protein
MLKIHIQDLLLKTKIVMKQPYELMIKMLFGFRTHYKYARYKRRT